MHLHLVTLVDLALALAFIKYNALIYRYGPFLGPSEAFLESLGPQLLLSLSR